MRGRRAHRNSGDQRLLDLERRIKSGDATAAIPIAAHLLRSLGEEGLVDYGHRLVHDAGAKFARANKWWTEQFEAWDKDHPGERVPAEVETESDRQFDEARRSQEVGYAFWNEVNRLAWDEGLIDPLGLGTRGVSYSKTQNESTLMIRAERDVDYMIGYLRDDLSRLVPDGRVNLVGGGGGTNDYPTDTSTSKIMVVYPTYPPTYPTMGLRRGLLRVEVERSFDPIAWAVHADAGQGPATLVAGRSRPEVLKKIHDFVRSNLPSRPPSR